MLSVGAAVATLDGEIATLRQLTPRARHCTSAECLFREAGVRQTVKITMLPTVMRFHVWKLRETI